MKHLLKKISLMGAGGKPDKPKPPPPAKLEPPKIGKYPPYASYNQIEIVDLLCEGPIHGLVNSAGRDLEPENILQGIYLDDTSIVSNTALSNSSSEIFNDYALTVFVKLKELAGLLRQSKNCGKGSGFFQDIHNRTNGKLDTLVNARSTNILYKGALSLRWDTSYDRWKFVAFDYYCPALNADGWETNTNYSLTALNEGTVSFINDPLYCYKKENIEVHSLSTAKYSSLAAGCMKQFANMLNGTTASSYEKEILTKKIELIQSTLFRNTHSQYHTMGEWWWPYSIGGWIFFKVADSDTPLDIGFKSGVTQAQKKAVLNNKVIDFAFILKESSLEPNTVIDCIIPQIDTNGEFTGKVYGFIAIKIPVITYAEVWSNNYYYSSFFMVDSQIPDIFLTALGSVSLLGFTKNISQTSSSNNKYNYNNVLCEVKYGEGEQTPLNYFSKLYFDTDYKNKLLGPFRSMAQIRRFTEALNLLNPTNITTPALTGGGPTLSLTSTTTNYEGSADSERLSGKGSYTEVQQTFDEEAVPITHYVENIETASVIVTILINELTDTLTKALDIDGVSTNTTYQENPGTKIPTLVTINIITGKDIKGTISTHKNYTYTIFGNIPSACSIDFGNPNNDMTKLNFITYASGAEFNNPIELPTLSEDEQTKGGKRFVKIYKVSAETHSVLIRKEIYVEKITEIINSQFSYPFSALVGSKIDARNLSSVPMRSFDCRLKKIRVPANYNILEDGYDIRYQQSKDDYERAGRKKIYDGDWNGLFKVAWTDNPAWILYDILTSKRYGLGTYIDESQINVWDLYKIGRYCDAVDDNGYYFGVSDGRKGLEPRFSCNILFDSPIKVFDALNVISNLFRGSVFFSSSEINFSDDRPRDPVCIFNNTNIKDGIFNYISNKKEDIFNTVEVAYLDRFDNFKTKIELVEDLEDIRKRGAQKTVVNTMGVTSKAMARRIGQHIIWQTVKENQAIEFVAGLESLFCKPGDLILIDDELKTRNINCGRVLEVDVSNNSLRLDNAYDEVNFDKNITLYTPTGFLTKDELFDKAVTARNRYSSFIIRSGNNDINALTGEYFFDKYDSFNMPVYTGYHITQKHNLQCYYKHAASGWVIATGNSKLNVPFDEKVITPTRELYQPVDLSTLYLRTDRVGSTIAISGDVTYNNLYGGGIHDNEIITTSPRQITKYFISGISGVNDGSIVYLDPRNFNLNLLSIIEPGTTYRIDLKSPFVDEVYKVISIREENQNEYLIVATKYDKNKWSDIENDIFIENTQSLFYANQGLSKIKTLTQPNNLFFDIINENNSTFDITGSFYTHHPSHNQKITLENKAVGYTNQITIFPPPPGTSSSNYQAFLFSGLTDLGKYDLTVQTTSVASDWLDSYPAKTHKFIGYQKTELSVYDRPYIENFTIL